MIDQALKNSSQFAHPESSLAIAIWEFLEAFHDHCEKNHVSFAANSGVSVLPKERLRDKILRQSLCGKCGAKIMKYHVMKNNRCDDCVKARKRAYYLQKYNKKRTYAQVAP
jgi:formate dehydrogenase assembly factor FdhD